MKPAAVTSALSPASKVVRPTQRGLLKQQQILEAATELFLQHGFSAFSVDELIRQIGGSKSNVYRYFGDKQGLFAAVVQAMCSDILSELRALDVSRLSLEEALQQFASVLLRCLLRPRHLAFQRMIFAESERLQPVVARWWESGPRWSQASIVQILREHADPARPADDAELDRRAIYLHDMLVTHPVMRATLGAPLSRPQLQAHIQGAIGMLLRCSG
jgi:TetR/AcrR family transcriptional regulator, mexJK operon transcriptional repressor